MPFLYIDFESFSYANLPDVGTYRYAADPSTEILCVAWALDDAPVELIVGENLPTDIPEDTILVAHNIEFEREMMHHRFGIKTDLCEWIDTAAMSARMGLPRNLEEASEFFGLETEEKRDANTARFGDSVCRPRKASRNNPATRWTPETNAKGFEALYRRCIRDVELARELHRRLPPLEPEERRLWELTINMNQRGVKIDLPSIPLARAVIEKESVPMIEEFTRLTGCKVKSYVKVAQNLGLPDVRKPTVRKALRSNLEPRVRRALEIYQALSKSSLGKLDAMEARSDADARVRGSFMYCGAERTGRWSSHGVQLQNLKRGIGETTEIAFRALQCGALEFILEGADASAPHEPKLSPTGIVSEMMKGFLIGPFVVGDFSTIEPRVLGWMAGDEDQLTLFRSGGDPYCTLASEIYNRTITKKDVGERFMGKQGELGCGYGLGPDGFQFMLDDTYDVQITDLLSEQVVNAYKRRHPMIVKFWKRLNDGFVYTLAKKAPSIKVTRNIRMGYLEHGGRPYLWMEIPSGRKLYYGDPELVTTRRGPAVSYYGRDRYSGGWSRVRTYGGKLAENATQATARDIMGRAMLRLEEERYLLEMTVHDEAASQDDGRPLATYKGIMEIVPEWAVGLPIKVDAYKTLRYRK